MKRHLSAMFIKAKNKNELTEKLEILFNKVKYQRYINRMVSKAIKCVKNEVIGCAIKKIDGLYYFDKYLEDIISGNYFQEENCETCNSKLDKLVYMNCKGIYLIQVFEDEWLYNREFIFNLLKSYVIKDKKEIRIKNINYINKNNKVKLYNKDNLIASLNYKFNSKNIIIKDLYFNYKYDNNILLKVFIKILVKYNKDIIYKANLCHYNFLLDNIFSDNGFEKIDFIEPKFKYIATNTDNKHRFSRKEIMEYKNSRNNKDIKEAKVYNAGYVIYAYKVD